MQTLPCIELGSGNAEIMTMITTWASVGPLPNGGAHSYLPKSRIWGFKPARMATS